jgi:RNA polymerase sigma factor (sigma-70 family)
MLLISSGVVQSDLEKIEAIRNNTDQKDYAFMLIYKECRPMIRQLGGKFKLREDDCEDVLQEAILLFWEKIHTNKLELTGKISTYIFGVCRNKFMNINRDGKKIKILEAEDLASLPDLNDGPDENLYAQNHEKLAKFLNELGERCKEIISQFYLGTSMETLAVKYNYSTSATVTNMKYKCMQQLKRKFDSSLN